MIKYTFYTLLLSTLLVTSCVDRKTSESNETQNGEKVVRLEDKSTGKVPGSDTSDPSMSDEDEKEITDAKSVINDYYDAFTRKAPREAYDMWAPKNTPSNYDKFSKENPNYENITVTFEKGATVQKMGKDYQIKMPIRVSATSKDGDIVNSSGEVTLMKKASAENPEYKITAMNLKSEDS